MRYTVYVNGERRDDIDPAQIIDFQELLDGDLVLRLKTLPAASIPGIFPDAWVSVMVLREEDTGQFPSFANGRLFHKPLTLEEIDKLARFDDD